MSNLAAINDRVVLKEIEVKEKNYGRIHIPDVEQNSGDFFEVVDCGPGVYNPMFNLRVPMDVKVGDVVVVPKGVCRLIKIKGEDFYVTREAELLVKYNQEQTNADESN